MQGNARIVSSIGFNCPGVFVVKAVVLDLRLSAFIGG
jgi:hypothetical protein